MVEPSSPEPDAIKIERLRARFGSPLTVLKEKLESLTAMGAAPVSVGEPVAIAKGEPAASGPATSEPAKEEPAAKPNPQIFTSKAAQDAVFTSDTEIGKLLQQHAAAVAEIEKGLRSHRLYKPEVHDDLWRLRFLLSAKNDASKATANAVTCLEWREENKIDAIAEQLLSVSSDQWPGFPHVQRFTPMHVVNPNPDGGCVVFMKMGEQDYDGLLGPEKAPSISESDWLMCQFYNKEWLFMRRDAISRRTGSLSKNIIILDMGGLGRKHFGNSRYKKLMTHAAIKKADDMYPQSLGTLVVIGLPGALSWIFNTVIKPLAPPKVQEKIQVTSDPPKVYTKLGLNPDVVPTAMGGKTAGWPPTYDSRCEPPF